MSFLYFNRRKTLHIYVSSSLSVFVFICLICFKGLWIVSLLLLSFISVDYMYALDTCIVEEINTGAHENSSSPICKILCMCKNPELWFTSMWLLLLSYPLKQVSAVLVWVAWGNLNLFDTFISYVWTAFIRM